MVRAVKLEATHPPLEAKDVGLKQRRQVQISDVASTELVFSCNRLGLSVDKIQNFIWIGKVITKRHLKDRLKNCKAMKIDL